MRYIWVYIEYHLHKIGLKKLYVKRGSIPIQQRLKAYQNILVLIKILIVKYI